MHFITFCFFNAENYVCNAVGMSSDENNTENSVVLIKRQHWNLEFPSTCERQWQYSPIANGKWKYEIAK